MTPHSGGWGDPKECTPTLSVIHLHSQTFPTSPKEAWKRENPTFQRMRDVEHTVSMSLQGPDGPLAVCTMLSLRVRLGGPGFSCCLLAGGGPGIWHGAVPVWCAGQMLAVRMGQPVLQAELCLSSRHHGAFRSRVCSDGAARRSLRSWGSPAPPGSCLCFTAMLPLGLRWNVCSGWRCFRSINGVSQGRGTGAPRCTRQMLAPWFLPSRLPRLESADFSSETQTTASADKHRIYCSAEVQSLPTTLPGEQTAFLLFLRDTEDAEERV